MTESLEKLRWKINGAKDLGSVVRTMKALAASSITQYENAVRSLNQYYRTIEMGLALSFQQSASFISSTHSQKRTEKTGLIIFGSDQGLVGRFNEILSDYVQNLPETRSEQKSFWAVGDRIRQHLEDGGIPADRWFTVPNSVGQITPLVGDILEKIEEELEQDRMSRVYLIHNQPVRGSSYKPVSQCILPLDEIWRGQLAELQWPSKNLPELIGEKETVQQNLISEFLFVSLYKACAESLASENASRLAAMQRAEKNIDEMLENLNLEFHRLRQTSIDEELFDIISGSEAQSPDSKR